MLPEEWRPVVGYEGLYEVSSHGKIRSLDRWISHLHCKSGKTFRTGKIIKPKSMDNGYFRAEFWRNQRRERPHVHRVVALHFVANPDNKPWINHKDGNKRNNYFENLEWVTPAENALHAVALGLSKIGENAAGSKLTNEDAIAVRVLYDKGLPPKWIAGIFGVSSTKVVQIGKRQHWKHL